MVKCIVLAKVHLSRYSCYSFFFSVFSCWIFLSLRQCHHLSCMRTMILQILNLAYNKSDIERRVHAVIDKFAERGLRSLAVAFQACYCFNLFSYCFNFFSCYATVIVFSWCITNLFFVPCWFFFDYYAGCSRWKERKSR